MCLNEKNGSLFSLFLGIFFLLGWKWMISDLFHWKVNVNGRMGHEHLLNGNTVFLLTYFRFFVTLKMNLCCKFFVVSELFHWKINVNGCHMENNGIGHEQKIKLEIIVGWEIQCGRDKRRYEGKRVQRQLRKIKHKKVKLWKCGNIKMSRHERLKTGNEDVKM